jgi:hypothetical protein
MKYVNFTLASFANARDSSRTHCSAIVEGQQHELRWTLDVPTSGAAVPDEPVS